MFVEIRCHRPSRTNEQIFLACPVKRRKSSRRGSLRVTVVFAEIFFDFFYHRLRPGSLLLSSRTDVSPSPLNRRTYPNNFRPVYGHFETVFTGIRNPSKGERRIVKHEIWHSITGSGWRSRQINLMPLIVNR